MYDFEFLTANRAVSKILMLDAFNALKMPNAICLPIMPGSGPIQLLVHAKIGKTPEKWFSPGDKADFKPSFTSRLANNYIIYMGRIFGTKFPKPEYISLNDASHVAQWIVDSINNRGGAYMLTYASAAVRICQTAKEMGLNFTGAKFLIAAEPITEAKRREIESTGANACPFYVFVEAGYVGIGCFAPIVTDDMHFLKDSFALIQRQRQVPHASTSVNAFLFTTLLPSSPKVLLNTESGDYGVIETRNCGCKFDELGLNDHIHSIRGFDKLSSAGTTFVGSDLLKIIEEVLPAKFGGASIDYQIIEEEDERGHTHLSLVVSPDVGTIDETELIQTVISELGKGGDWKRMMADVCVQENTLQVKRIRPLLTARGKLLPLHINKKGQDVNT
jgi:hypothetical protein